MSDYIKENFTIILSLIYIISPIDLIPEALLGPLGILDDLGVVFFLLGLSTWKFFNRNKQSAISKQSTSRE